MTTTTKAPDLYPVNSEQLAEEMHYVEVAGSMKWGGTFTIIKWRSPLSGQRTTTRTHHKKRGPQCHAFDRAVH